MIVGTGFEKKQTNLPIFLEECGVKRQKMRAARHVSVREMAGWCLVLVFAATHRHLALRAAWVGEHAGPP